MSYSVYDLENEQIYLHANKNSDIIKQIEILMARKRSWASVKEEFYKDTIHDYNDFITFIAQFLKDLKIDNHLIINLILRKMLCNGFFSMNNKLEYSSSECCHDIRLYEGMDVITGKGCCRHITGFQNDVLKKAGITSGFLCCYAGDYNTNLKKAQTSLANHAVNLIQYNDVYYAYDVINNLLFKFINELVMEQIINNQNPLQIYHKPSSNMIETDLSYEQMRERLADLRKSSQKRAISYRTFAQIQKEANLVYNHNEDLFNDLKKDAKTRVRKLDEELEDSLNRVASYFSD